MTDIEGILYGTAPTTQETKVVEAHVLATTSVEIKDQGKMEQVKHEEKVLETKLLDGSSPPVYLSIKYSTTIPLGEFRMCRVEKSLFIPMGVEAHAGIKEKIEATNKWGCSLLEQLMEKEVTEALAEKNKGNVMKKDEDLLFG